MSSCNTNNTPLHSSLTLIQNQSEFLSTDSTKAIHSNSLELISSDNINLIGTEDEQCGGIYQVYL